MFSAPREYTCFVVGTEAGSYLRLIDACMTHRKAQGPSRITQLKAQGPSVTRVKKKKKRVDRAVMREEERVPRLPQGARRAHPAPLGCGLRVEVVGLRLRVYRGTFSIRIGAYKKEGLHLAGLQPLQHPQELPPRLAGTRGRERLSRLGADLPSDAFDLGGRCQFRISLARA